MGTIWDLTQDGYQPYSDHPLDLLTTFSISFLALWNNDHTDVAWLVIINIFVG